MSEEPVRIPLVGKYSSLFVLVDRVDAEFAGNYLWYGYKQRDLIFAKTWVGQEGGPREQNMQRLLTGWRFVKHVDGNTLNNQRANLRRGKRVVRYPISTGAVFGELTVIETDLLAPRTKKDQPIAGIRAVKCRCSCGKEKVFQVSRLVSGRTKSCGCLRGLHISLSCQERFKDLPLPSRHPWYQMWRSMIYRCHVPENTSYASYGGRGIRVYEPWRSDFWAFVAWMDLHLGKRPSDKHSLDRIDNDGDYVPGNLRWADARTQMNNRRRQRFVTAEEEHILDALRAGKLVTVSA